MSTTTFGEFLLKKFGWTTGKPLSARGLVEPIIPKRRVIKLGLGAILHGKNSTKFRNNNSRIIWITFSRKTTSRKTIYYDQVKEYQKRHLRKLKRLKNMFEDPLL